MEELLSPKMIATIERITFLNAVEKEIERSTELFPSSDMVLAALMEEVGELAQAVLERERTLRDGKPIGKWTRTNLVIEAVQVAAMAARLAIEGDPRYPYAALRDGGQPYPDLDA